MKWALLHGAAGPSGLTVTTGTETAYNINFTNSFINKTNVY
jgi:hypothetical protein